MARAVHAGADPQALALIEAAARHGGPGEGLAAAASLIEAVVIGCGAGGVLGGGAMDAQMGEGRIGRDRRRALDDGVARLRLSAGTFRLLAQVLADDPLAGEAPAPAQ